MWNQGALQLSVDCMAVPVTDTSLLVFWPVLNFKTLGHNGIELTNFPLVILAIQLKIDILTICNIFWSKGPLCVSASPFSSSCYCVIKQSGPICLRAAGS